MNTDNAKNRRESGTAMTAETSTFVSFSESVSFIVGDLLVELVDETDLTGPCSSKKLLCAVKNISRIMTSVLKNTMPKC